MANTYSSILVHIAFSTKNRQSLISDTLRKRLYPYMGGIARENGFMRPFLNKSYFHGRKVMEHLVSVFHKWIKHGNTSKIRKHIIKR